MTAPGRFAVTTADQNRFAQVVTEKLRESRRRQKLTQAEVANRTRGLVSKAALANYETGHRSLRIDVLWVITRALGEDLGQLLTRVENEVYGNRGIDEAASSIRVRMGHLRGLKDSRLDPVLRWFDLRRPTTSEPITDDTVVTLDAEVLPAMAAITGLTSAELRGMLVEPSA